MKVRMASNSSVFANRGDPWISEHDQNSYGKRDDEDPDVDRFTRARKAIVRETVAATKAAIRDETEAGRIKDVSSRLRRELAQIKQGNRA